MSPSENPLAAPPCDRSEPKPSIPPSKIVAVLPWKSHSTAARAKLPLRPKAGRPSVGGDVAPPETSAGAGDLLGRKEYPPSREVAPDHFGRRQRHSPKFLERPTPREPPDKRRHPHPVASDQSPRPELADVPCPAPTPWKLPPKPANRDRARETLPLARPTLRRPHPPYCRQGNWPPAPPNHPSTLRGAPRNASTRASPHLAKLPHNRGRGSPKIQTSPSPTATKRTASAGRRRKGSPLLSGSKRIRLVLPMRCHPPALSLG